MWNKLQLALERISLARQLTAFSVVTSAAALFIASAILIAYDASWSRERLVLDTITLAELAGSNSREALTFGDATAARDTRRVAPDRRFAQLRGRGGAGAARERFH